MFPGVSVAGAAQQSVNMNTIASFSPIEDKSARTLVLGSMPGVMSLKANQYYAHPRNAFWPIMADILGFSAGLPYGHRVEALKSSGIALWDVLQVCKRQGSLDAAIETGSRVPNDFRSFFDDHPGIRLVAFNGAEAEKSFNALVLPRIDITGIRCVRLPSSSPAHAVPLERKIAAWWEVLGVGNNRMRS